MVIMAMSSSLLKPVWSFVVVGAVLCCLATGAGSGLCGAGVGVDVCCTGLGAGTGVGLGVRGMMPRDLSAADGSISTQS
jgi:hypothetical protein